MFSVDLNYQSIPVDYASQNSAGKSPLLILHGLFGQINNWNSISKSFYKFLKRPIILADLRNHGSSPHTSEMSYETMANDVESLIYRISPQNPRCILLGHSLGGKVACQLALTKSHLIEKLIIEDIVPRSSSGNEKTDMAPILRAMLKAECPQSSLVEARREMGQILLENGIQNESIRSFILTNVVEKEGKIVWKINLPTIEKFIYDMHGFPMETLTKKFDKPTMFVFGKKSPFYKGSADDWYLSSIFENLIIRTIDCGHWVHAEKPKEFTDTVVDFLGK